MKRLLLSLMILSLLCALLPFSVAAEDHGEVEPNETSDTATEIPLNGSVTGSLSHFKDADWYCFTVTEPGYFFVSITHEPMASDSKLWGVYLYNSNFYPIDGSTAFLGNYVGVSARQNWTSARYGVDAGKFYLSVKEAGNHGAVQHDYTVSVSFTAASDWEKEDNSSLTKSQSLPLFSTVCGTISTGGDHDWYRFTVAEPAEVVLSVAHLTQVANGNGWRFELYNADGDRVYRSQENDVKAAALEVSYALTQAGTYYLHLDAEYGCRSTAPYRLTVAQTHDCAGEFAITQLPTCTQEGVQENCCSLCGKLLERKAAPALGHESDFWTIDVPATCTSAGQRHGYCNRCEKDVTEAISMLPHTYGAWQQVSGNLLIPPIVTEQTCTVCGATARERDWTYVWVPIAAAVGLILLAIGGVSYAKAFRKK